MKKHEFCNIFITTEQNMTANGILTKLDFRDVTSMTLKRAAVNFLWSSLARNKNVI
jgi:hypothetical protein